MLIAHATIETTLGNIVAGSLEVHAAELSITIALRKERLRSRKGKSRNGEY
jgi:hypothetical protein